MKYLSAICFCLFLSSCSDEKSKPLTTQIGELYNKSLQNDVTKNWQNRIYDKENCVKYKEEIWKTGKKHASAASGAFVNDMNAILGRARKEGCVIR
jgi:hypothetical protein